MGMRHEELEEYSESTPRHVAEYVVNVFRRREQLAAREAANRAPEIASQEAGASRKA